MQGESSQICLNPLWKPTQTHLEAHPNPIKLTMKIGHDINHIGRRSIHLWKCQKIFHLLRGFPLLKYFRELGDFKKCTFILCCYRYHFLNMALVTTFFFNSFHLWAIHYQIKRRLHPSICLPVDEKSTPKHKQSFLRPRLTAELTLRFFFLH